MEFAPATEEDLPHIAFLENAMEGPDAASLETLQTRLLMFPQGFLVAREGERIIGYIESCLWDREVPAFQGQPDFFPDQHDTAAATLYIIFVGVDERFRRRGVGTQLIDALLEETHRFAPQRVHAVSREALVPFYQSMGFTATADLHGFLHQEKYTLMELALQK